MLPDIVYSNYDIITSLGKNTDWIDNVPAQSRVDYDANGLAIGKDEYEPTWNNVLSSLLNKIAKSIIQSGIMSDPLSQFRRGNFGMLGDTLEQIFVGLVKAATYNPNYEDGTPWKTEKPNVDSMFHRNPRREVFKQTLYRDDLAKAFRTEGGLSTLVNTIIGAMTSSNIAAQYIWAKRVLYTYITAPDVPLLATQTRPVDMVVDSATGDAFIIALKQAILDLRFNSTLYNPKAAATSTTPDRLALFVHKNVLPTLEVKTLAGAFNIGQMSVDVPIIPLDNFGGQTNTLAVLCDRDFFLIFNQMLRFEQIYNPEKLYTNVWLHVWEQYCASYYHNAILFNSNTPVPFMATGVESELYGAAAKSKK